MDSVTRVAMAQREIGLASGEPPTTKGYTPSVFALLPKLLERAGRTQRGSITGLYTILVDNDDMTEPIADAVRSILDGHIVLSRSLAHKNHFPAVDVLESVSRVSPKVITKEQRQLSQKTREILAIYKESEDLINIGAYVKGSSAKIDFAIAKIDALNDFLKQDMHEYDFDAALWQKLAQLISWRLEKWMKSKFEFRLETVLKVRKHQEILQKQAFAKVLQKKAALEQHKEEVSDQLNEYISSDHIAVNKLHFEYMQGRHNQLFNLANRINKANNDVERERKKMMEARRKTLALENLESKQKIQFIKDLDKAEQLVMNEIATQRFNRERS